MRRRKADLQSNIAQLSDLQLGQLRDDVVLEPQSLPHWALPFAVNTVRQLAKMEAVGRAERLREQKRQEWLATLRLGMVKTLDELRAIVDRCKAGRSFVLDTETAPGTGSALNTLGNRIAGYVLGPALHEAFYVPVGHTLPDGQLDPRNLPAHEAGLLVRELCLATQTRPGPRALLWNAAFDFETLAPVIGFDVWHPESFEDGQLALFNRDTTRRYGSLKDTTREFLGQDPLDIDEVLPDLELGYGVASLDDPRTTQYAALDGVTTRLVLRHRECQPKHFPSYELDKQVLGILSEIERHGICVDIDQARILEGVLQARIGLEEEQLQTLVPGHDLSAPAGVRQYLFGPPPGLGLAAPVRTKKGALSVNKNALRMLRETQPLPALDLLDGINLDRKLMQYIGKVASSAHQVVRPSLSLVSAATARIIASGGKPEHGFTTLPLQQIPKHLVDDEHGRWTRERYEKINIRSLVRARTPEHVLLATDFSEQEYRIAANLSGEENWIKLMLAGHSMHTRLAEQAFGILYDKNDEHHVKLRGLAKTTNFTLLFGGQIHTLVSRGMERELAEQLYQAYLESSPSWQRYVDGRTREGFRNGYVTNAFDRPLSLRGAFDSELRRKCANYPVQATGGDILKHCLVLIRAAFVERGWWHNGSARIVLPIHDELLVEALANIAGEVGQVVREVMESIVPKFFPEWPVPIPVTQRIGSTWG